MEDIKYGQLWARYSEVINQEDLGKYRIDFDGLKNAVAEVLKYLGISKEHPDALTIKDYEEVLAGHRRLVKQLNTLINGPWPVSAEQPSLCDIVKQIESEGLMVRKTGAGWVKASERMPKNDLTEDYPMEYCLKCKNDGSRGQVEYRQGNFADIIYMLRSSGYDAIWWLDESGTAAAAREEDAVEFAEWAATIAFFDDGTRLWELLGEGEAINGQFRFTTKEFYQLFKQQKEK